MMSASSDPPSEPKTASRIPETLLSISFNQDATRFSVTTTSGFYVFSCHPFQLLLRHTHPGKGISVAQMLLRSNTFALVGGGPYPKYPPYKVMMWEWNNNQGRFFAEVNLKSEVKSVRLQKEFLIIVQLRQIYIYNMADKIWATSQPLRTVENHKGLCEVSCCTSNSSQLLVCPGLLEGQVRVYRYGKSDDISFIKAHETSISCLGLTMDGMFVATASVKGTLIRVFNTFHGTLLLEFRRGSDKAEINSLAFSSDARWLATSSDKGTIHVFSLNLNKIGSPGIRGVLRMSSGLVKGVLPKYFSSEWSVAQFRLKEGVKYIVAFDQQENQQDTVLIVGMDGSYYKCRFDLECGGEMTQLEYNNFLKLVESSEDSNL